MSTPGLFAAQSVHAANTKTVVELQAKLKVALAAKAESGKWVMRESAKAEKARIAKLMPAKLAKVAPTKAKGVKVIKKVVSKGKSEAVCAPCAPVKRGRPKLSDCNACRRRLMGIPGNGKGHTCGKVLWSR